MPRDARDHASIAGDAIGKQVGLASLRFPLMTIVGVVADVKRLSLREQPGPEMYVPFTQKPYPSMLKMQVVLRTATDPATVTASARDAIHSVDSGLPVARVTTLAALVENSMAQPRFSMLLFGAFGLLSLALASIGMYGVFSYSVAQRIQEIGVRMALGAQRRNIFKMVLRQGMQLAGIGIAIGLLVAVGVARVMASLLSNYLYGVDAYDLLTFSGVSALLIVVALLACFVPARRAASVDPNIALRYE